MVQNKTQSNSALKNGFNRIWNVKEIGIIVPTVIYAIFVQIINPVFFTPMNLANLFRQTGFVLIPALGMTLVLIAAGIDLSVGSVMGLGGVVAGFAWSISGCPSGLALCLRCWWGYSSA